MRAICANHHCPRFEFAVAVSDDIADAETERCSECSQLLLHESGETFKDALYRREARDTLQGMSDQAIAFQDRAISRNDCIDRQEINLEKARRRAIDLDWDRAEAEYLDQA